ncbi:MAG: hypothetical protein ACK6AD_09300 [Cyanobacteriota bacterium]|jgi:hypothetical protein
MKPPVKNLFDSLNQRLSSIETSLTRRENVLSFLIIRFVFMSGLVLGFAWTFLQLSP